MTMLLILHASLGLKGSDSMCSAPVLPCLHGGGVCLYQAIDKHFGTGEGLISLPLTVLATNTGYHSALCAVQATDLKSQNQDKGKKKKSG